ncbi:MAG: TrpB-like pyridoxal-phosphate dependent enzyme, partial [Eubacteriales bacterium]|nr:TrpB-like pyridoxal-phosphate dependent enzyme [Eubacteriales bacterium]
MATAKIPYRTYLTEEQLPKYWYNIRSVMKEDAPPMLNPGTGKPMTYDELTHVFTDGAVGQELDSKTEYVEIPDEVRHIYSEYRPSPLVRAYNVEKA